MRRLGSHTKPYFERRHVATFPNLSFSHVSSCVFHMLPYIFSSLKHFYLHRRVAFKISFWLSTFSKVHHKLPYIIKKGRSCMISSKNTEVFTTLIEPWKVTMIMIKIIMMIADRRLACTCTRSNTCQILCIYYVLKFSQIYAIDIIIIFTL